MTRLGADLVALQPTPPLSRLLWDRPQRARGWRPVNRLPGGADVIVGGDLRLRVRHPADLASERTGMATGEATLLDALRAVPGVAAADIEADERPEGAGTLRLQLAPGADEIAVATSVNRVLREQFGLAVDAGRVQVVEESLSPEEWPPAVDDSDLGAADTSSPVAPVAPPLAAPQSTQSAQPSQAAQSVTPEAASRPTLTAVPEYREDSSATTELGTDPTPDQEPHAAPDAALANSATDEYLTPELIESTRPPRILIQKMQLVSAGLGVTTSVSLSWQGNAFLGESSAAATPSSVHRSVATATLRALEEVVGSAARFELEQLEINQLGPDRAVVVVVAMLTRLGSERLTGVSVVREDVRQAVIRATLDALNRRLESLLDPA